MNNLKIYFNNIIIKFLWENKLKLKKWNLIFNKNNNQQIIMYILNSKEIIVKNLDFKTT